MEFLEKDLEQIIYETENMELFERGLNVSGKLYRQLRIGNYGIADLVSFHTVGIVNDTNYYFTEENSKLVVTVYELKKGKIGVNTFLQALRYCKGIKRYIEFRDKYFPIEFKICLIGRCLENSNAFCYANDLISNIDIYSYNFEFDGIKFKREQGYKLTEEGF